jgi:hypothetical protein
MAELGGKRVVDSKRGWAVGPEIARRQGRRPEVFRRIRRRDIGLNPVDPVQQLSGL